MTTATDERVCMITMPDAYDVPSHLAQCRDADEAANYVYRGRGDVFWRSLITYPELLHVSGVTRVYIAWRGQLRAWHRADLVRRLRLDDLQGMHPSLAARMHRGEPYQWVVSEATPLPHTVIPPLVAAKPLRFGTLERRAPGSIELPFASGNNILTWEP